MIMASSFTGIPYWNDSMTSMCRTTQATYDVTKEFGCHL